jgi:hypothetical protein
MNLLLAGGDRYPTTDPGLEFQNTCEKMLDWRDRSTFWREISSQSVGRPTIL